MLPHVRTRGELNLLILEMLGELNASHNGIGGGDDPAKEKLVDLENLIDYMIITYYTGDRDGPGSRYTQPRPNNYFGIYNRKVIDAVLSMSEPFRSFPLLVLWLDYGMTSKVAMATLIIYFPVTAAFFDGLRRKHVAAFLSEPPVGRRLGSERARGRCR